VSRAILQVTIRGRVQGVGYRAWMMRQAAGLGLRGWVRNRADGSVEALVIGARESVERLVAACGQGPLGARVTDVTVSSTADDGSDGFSARATE